MSGQYQLANYVEIALILKNELQNSTFIIGFLVCKQWLYGTIQPH